MGNTETTREAKRYVFPGYSNIELWDLPGFGTRTNRDLKTFSINFGIHHYDAFIIIFCHRLTKDSLDLAKMLVSLGKPYIFVRSKIDQDIANAKHQMRSKFDEEAELGKIRNEFKKMKKTFFAERPQCQIGDVFLINCHDEKTYDFDKLLLAINCNLAIEQQNCFISAVSLVTKRILEEKIKVLKGI